MAFPYFVMFMAWYHEWLGGNPVCVLNLVGCSLNVALHPCQDLADTVVCATHIHCTSSQWHSLSVQRRDVRQLLNKWLTPASTIFLFF
jgi:hypothetical protein